MLQRVNFGPVIFHDGQRFLVRVKSGIEELQERLGDINDHATAQARFQQWIAKLPPNGTAATLAEMIVNEHTTFVQARDDFLAWCSSCRFWAAAW